MEQNNQSTSDLRRLKAAIDSGTRQQLANMIEALHPSETARLIEALPPAKRSLIWDLTNEEGEVLVELNEEVRAGLLEDMAAEEVVAATEGMELDDLADLVADLPEDITQ